MSYIILRFLALFGIVWDLRKPPEHIVARVAKKVNRLESPGDFDAGRKG